MLRYLNCGLLDLPHGYPQKDRRWIGTVIQNKAQLTYKYDGSQRFWKHKNKSKHSTSVSSNLIHQSKPLKIKPTMHFNVVAILSLARIVSASAIPEVDSSLPETSNSLEILSKRSSYNCKGNPLCGSTANLRSWCDNTVNNKITRDNLVRYGAPGYAVFAPSFILNSFTNIVL